MSLINKMLQDLDRRNAIGSASGPVPPQQVRAVSPPDSGHEWFWRTLAVLALVAVSWVGWVAYQMQPRSLATEMALKGGALPRANAAPPAAKESAPALPAEAPAAPKALEPTAVSQVARSETPAPPPELFKLALSIDRPLQARLAPAVRPKAARAPIAKVSDSIRVTRNDTPRTAADEAELQFRRGVQWLNEGRISDAQRDFQAALAKFPGHEASRQALISILLERRQLEEARRQLEEGLAQNPAQSQFATVLARVLVEGRDYTGAETVLEAAQAAGANDGDFQLLQGAVLQRLGRHVEALAALHRAVKIADQPSATWVAMGISYEATGRKAEALQAYRRSLGLTPIAQDVRAYAEGRIRELN